MLFLKRLSDRFQEGVERTVAEGVDPDTAESDPDEHEFFVPRDCRWPKLASSHMNLGEVLNRASLEIEDANTPRHPDWYVSSGLTERVMDVRAVSVEVVRPYVIEVVFGDGTRRRLDLESELWGEVFEPLRDPELFAQARIDSEWGTVVWPTGADLSPEFLHEASTTPPRGQ